MKKEKPKIVFLGIPALGGNFTHYQYLSEGLKNYDWTLLSLGKSKEQYTYPNFVHIGKDLERKNNQKELATLLRDYLIKNEVDILIPMNSPIAVSLIPFVPQSVKVINIVNSNTERVYKYVSEHLDYVAKIICISKKQKEELGQRKGTEEKLILIPHGVFPDSGFGKTRNPILKIGFLGRLHHQHKGILLIPEILSKLSFDYHFEILGDGEDKTELINQLKHKNISFTDFDFQTGIEKEEIVSNWDFLIFPSFVEGFGLTLIECMKYGVIPIANKIEGITDYIIQDGEDGFLIKGNKIEAYVDKLNLVAENTELQKNLSSNAIQKIREQFNLEQILTTYDETFQEAMKFQKPNEKVFSRWKPYKEYKPSLFDRLKLKFKKL